MKYLILFLFPIVFSSCKGNNDTADSADINNIDLNYCDCMDLVHDQAYNNFFLEDRRKGYTGTCKSFYGNGQLSLLKNFTAGKVDGEMTLYYENGQIKEQRYFVKGLQNGDMYLYKESGQLTFHGIYKNGRHLETVFALSNNLDND